MPAKIIHFNKPNDCSGCDTIFIIGDALLQGCETVAAGTEYYTLDLEAIAILSYIFITCLYLIEEE